MHSRPAVPGLWNSACTLSSSHVRKKEDNKKNQNDGEEMTIDSVIERRTEEVELARGLATRFVFNAIVLVSWQSNDFIKFHDLATFTLCAGHRSLKHPMLQAIKVDTPVKTLCR